jgi:hypothetical protein
MKEQFKQLWETSDEIKVCYPEQGSPVSVSAKTLETFAELIVQKCAGIADEPTSQPFRSYGEKIKKHFGVKE